MAAVTKILGAARALLLLLAALLPAGSRADDVTFRQCKQLDPYKAGRVISPTEPAQEQDNYASTLDVKGCQLTEITGVIFNRRPNLRYMYYNDNKIQNVDPTVFTAAPQILYLFLNNNSFTSIPVFGKASVLPNVVGLSITYNKIKRLDNTKTFSSMKELRTLNLADNLIEFVSPDVFHGLPHLDEVNLSNNKLKYIPDNMFAVPTLDFVHLSNNLIEYVAPGAFRGTHLGYLYLNGNKLTYLPQHFVSSLTSNGGKLRYFLFYDNPFLQCGCMNELLAEVKQLAHCEYAANYYNNPEKPPACTQANPPQCNRQTEAEYLIISTHLLAPKLPGKKLLKLL